VENKLFNLHCSLVEQNSGAVGGDEEEEEEEKEEKEKEKEKEEREGEEG
jgi:hypothetical protein